MMEYSRKIERMFFHNPTLPVADYPLLDRDLFEIQEFESLAFDYSVNSLCYTYVREFNNNWFVDIYLYYSFYFENQINKKRFIIAPGYQMNENDENAFLAFVKMDDVLFNSRVCGDYVQDISNIAPDINMKPYQNLEIALFHTYFACYRSGIRELLLKAGLEYVAMDISTVDCWNVTASNIEEAFGIPINLIRKLNYPGGLQNATLNDLCRNELVLAYRAFHSILNDIDRFYETYHLLRTYTEHETEFDKKIKGKQVSYYD